MQMEEERDVIKEVEMQMKVEEERDVIKEVDNGFSSNRFRAREQPSR